MKDHNKFIEELHDKNPNIICIDTYIGCMTKINFECLAHNYIWKATPNQILQGGGCIKCKSGKIQKAHSFTHEDFLKKVQQYNPDIEILGVYENALQMIERKCKKCGKISTTQTFYLMHKKIKCMSCDNPSSSNGNLQKAEIIFEQNNPFLKILERTHNNKKVKILCSKCGKTSEIWRSAFKKKMKSCIHCKTAHNKSNHVEFIEKFNKLNSSIEILGKYQKANIKIEVRCKKCGHVWNVTPNSLLSNHGCPNECEAGETRSFTEKFIMSFFDNNKITYISQKVFDSCKYKAVLPFDFYLPDYNLCIEYQGEHHYFPIEHFGGQKFFEIQQIRDQIKHKYCENNNIKLLCIPYTDKNKIEKILEKELLIKRQQNGIYIFRYKNRN